MSNKTYFAEWLLPITSAPVHKAFISVKDGKIASLGPQSEYGGDVHAVQDLGSAILSPALVNALFHPDYPVADPQATPRGNFFAWLNSGKQQVDTSSKLEMESELLSAIKRCYDYGTAAIGIRTRNAEISSHLEHSGLYSVIFQTLKGFRENDASDIWKSRPRHEDSDLTRYYYAGEFLFNLTPQVFRDIARTSRRTALPVSFMKDEELFFTRGQGRIYQFLLSHEDMDYRWKPPRTSSIRYLLNSSFAAEQTILSQLIHLTEEELDLLAEREETFHMCLHPRFDRQWELGTAPGKLIYDKGFNICLGTFAEHMDIRAEMRSASAEYGFQASEIMKMATLNGAAALGLDERIGSLEPGKDARIYAIEPADSVTDPYEAILFTNDPLKPI